MRLTFVMLIGLGQTVSTAVCAAGAPAADNHWIILHSDRITVGVDADLSLTIYDKTADPIWRTAESSLPAVGVRIVKPATRPSAILPALGDANDRAVKDFDNGTHKGHRVRLRGLPGTDVELDLVLALAADGELMVEIEQVGGNDVVHRVANLYDWSTKPGADTYVVVPHGSGYLIRSDSPAPVHLDG